MKTLRQGWVLVVLLVSVFALFPVTAQASFEVQLTSFQVENGYTGEIYAVPSPFIPNYMYCIDKGTTVNVPGTYTGVLSILATTGQQEAAWIMNSYAYSTHGVYDSLSAAGTGAAVQLAIWYVTGQILQSDWVSTAYASAIQDFLNAGTSAGQAAWAAVAADYRYLALYDGSGNKVQSQIVAVPIPGAVWLLGSGLIGLLALRRKSVRQ